MRYSDGNVFFAKGIFLGGLRPFSSSVSPLAYSFTLTFWEDFEVISIVLIEVMSVWDLGCSNFFYDPKFYVIEGPD